uniref:Replication factor A C-terminal domain-containing protein n=1 Tax=Lactuca sativa TaxID=4236 RepID=A0A9R1WEL8_LACSA|nr:hypothetical protein LSAT_V11C200068380 [Lactuca sativa]
MVLCSMQQMWKKITPVPKANHSYTDPEKISENIVVGCTNAHCKKSEIQIVIKYIIPINVQDCTGTIGLTLFDREAKRLLNISAYELKKIHEARPETVMDYFQLYVALSRVQGREGLELLILDKDDKLTNKTFNVVYKEVFRNL